MSVKYVTGGGPDRWQAAAALHGEIFKTDPVLRFQVHQFDGEERDARISRLLSLLMKFSAASAATFDEAWASTDGEDHDSTAAPDCSAVWFRPRHSVDSLSNYLSYDAIKLLTTVGVSGFSRMVFQFQRSAEKAKDAGLRNPDGSKIKDYCYLFFISTAVEARGKGLSSELIRRFQEKAGKENLPIWLESTTERSHRLYLKLGFVDQSSWVLGKGAVNEEGVREPGGSGVRLWAMLWRPHREGDE